MVNCVFTGPMAVFEPVTNWLIAVETWAALEATVRSTGTPGAAPNRFKVTPLTAPATVLLALLTGTPSTVRLALAPAVAWVKEKAEPLALGSLIVKGVVPLLLVIARDWLPLASVVAVAVTPRLGVTPLIAAASWV